ncbi:MAG: hypothetical protein R2697_01970 [Ilumatobacteraceae bacterium]
MLLGVVVSALVFWNDGRDDAPATTTVPRDELAAEITTPPTLPPVETVPTTTAPTPSPRRCGPRRITVQIVSGSRRSRRTMAGRADPVPDPQRVTDRRGRHRQPLR